MVLSDFVGCVFIEVLLFYVNEYGKYVVFYYNIKI